MIDKSLSDWVGVHVVEFLDHFCAGVDVEIVIAALPETRQETFLVRKTQAELSFRRALSCSHATRKSLLEDLDDFAGRSRAGFADEQVEMLRHDDVTDESEAVASANFLEDLHGKIPGASGGQKRPSLVTAKGDEVKIAASGEALEILGHRREERPTLSKTKPERVGHPGRLLFITAWHQFIVCILVMIASKKAEATSDPPAL